MFFFFTTCTLEAKPLLLYYAICMKLFKSFLVLPKKKKLYINIYIQGVHKVRVHFKKFITLKCTRTLWTPCIYKFSEFKKNFQPMSKVTLFFKQIFNVYYNISLMNKNRYVLRISKRVLFLGLYQRCV